MYANITDEWGDEDYIEDLAQVVCISIGEGQNRIQQKYFGQIVEHF